MPKNRQASMALSKAFFPPSLNLFSEEVSPQT